VSSVLTDDSNQKTLPDGTIIFRDPRLPNAGVRILASSSFDRDSLCAEIGSVANYQSHRIGLGLPEAPIDLIADKSILLESGFDELNGVDWKKGCYMGQELTARTKYRGLIKKRLVPIHVEGDASTGDDILFNGKVVGDIRSLEHGMGIAMIKLDALRQQSTFDVGSAKISVNLPDWIRLPDPAD